MPKHSAQFTDNDPSINLVFMDNAISPLKKPINLQTISLSFLFGFFIFIFILIFFSPSFICWKGLQLVDPWLGAETGRAFYTLQQVNDPFIKVNNPAHKVIQWRLLFPILGYALNLSPILFLTIPFFGCVVLLSMVFIIISSESENLLMPIVITVLMGTTSWFFVSTGWLAYFDSWYLVGLIIIGFIPEKNWLVAACLLSPWIDERFIIGLPSALIVRQFFFHYYDKTAFKFFLHESLICLISLTPYLLLRIYFIVLPDGDTNTLIHIQRHWADFLKYMWNYIVGLWHGFRGVWFFIAIFVAFVFRNYGRRYGCIYLSVILITLLVNKMLAHDFSRSVSILLPAAIIGAIIMIRYRVRFRKYLVLFLAGCNLLLPGKHVVSNTSQEIKSFVTEYKKYYYKPPSTFNAELYFKRGLRYQQKSKNQIAYLYLTNAIRLDENDPKYYYARGLLLMENGTAKGRQKGCEDFSRASAIATKDWINRDELQTKIHRCQNMRF